MSRVFGIAKPTTRVSWLSCFSRSAHDTHFFANRAPSALFPVPFIFINLVQPRVRYGAPLGALVLGMLLACHLGSVHRWQPPSPTLLYPFWVHNEYPLTSTSAACRAPAR